MAHLWPISTKQLNMFQDWYLYVNKGNCIWLAPRLPILTSPCWQAGLHSSEPHSRSCWTWGTRAGEQHPHSRVLHEAHLTASPFPLESILQHLKLIGSTTASLPRADALTCCMFPAVPRTCSTHPTLCQPNTV